MARSGLYAIASGRTDDYKLGSRARLETLKSNIFSIQASYTSHWDECANFIRPRRQKRHVTDKNKGDRRNQNIIDATATRSSRTLSSGLHSGMSSPARPWLRSSIADADLARFKPVQKYLEEVTKIVLGSYTAANLYNSLPTLYGDCGDFGTGAISILPDSHDLFRSRVYPIASYGIGLDARGLATTFVRDYSLTVYQLIEEFGLKNGGTDIEWSRFSQTVKDHWDKGEYETQIPLTWIVTPNPNHDPRKPLAKYMKWQSCIYESGRNGDQDFVRESGYRSFPFMVPRWDVTDDDVYGTDWPAAIALGDIKGLQIMHREKAKAVQKMVTPPMVASYEVRTQATSSIPGGVTYTRDPQHGFRAAYQIDINLGDLRLDIHDVQYAIKDCYYVPLFLMLSQADQAGSNPEKTAYEIAERKEEKMVGLGPVLERFNDELFDLLYDRVFEMLEDAGRLPEPPQELEGVEIKPEYTSILAQAQKLVGVNAQDRLLQTAKDMAQVWPQLRHKVDPFRAFDNYGEMYGTDPLIIRTDDDAEAAMADEAQAAQAAQAAENARNMGAGLKAAGDAKLQGGQSVLDQLVGA
jgi:hypothetical protein